MKKMMIILMGLFMMICFAGTASAATSDNGADLSIADTNGGSGATLTFTPSPGCDLETSTSATAYTVSGCNRKATSDGIIYMMVSATAQIYQKPQASTNTTGALPDISATAGSTAANFVARN